MWPSEYMLHEHRKDMLRTAAEISLANEVRGERPSLIQSLIRMFNQTRLRRVRRSRPIAILPVAQPQCTPLRRVS
jgi:hypothetical protein